MKFSACLIIESGMPLVKSDSIISLLYTCSRLNSSRCFPKYLIIDLDAY